MKKSTPDIALSILMIIVASIGLTLEMVGFYKLESNSEPIMHYARTTFLIGMIVSGARSLLSKDNS